MQLRTYRGNSIAEALTAVKRELGPDALVVHTRTCKVGGVLGVGAREEIEIIASPAPAGSRPAPITRPMPASSESTGKAAALRLAAAYAPARPAEPERPARPAPAPRPAEPRVEIMQVRQRRAGVVASIAPTSDPTPTPAPAPGATDVHGELGAIRLMVAQLLAGNPPQGAPIAAPAMIQGDPLADWYLRLLSAAVSRELAERIVAEVRRAAPGSDAATLRRAFLECIASHLPAAREPLALPGPADPRPRTLALVGATGVGKTTSIAKLAAQAKLTAGTRVSLVTCDTNRIGAIEQLRTYAQVLGVPFRVAATAQEMGDVRASCADTDLLLVDTPGLSPRDERGIASLSEILRAARPDEIHLALPASGSEASLLHAWKAFEPLAPSRLLFTKLDEAVTYGVILSVADRVRAELSYITTGPRIPEQIEAAAPERLAELIAA